MPILRKISETTYGMINFGHTLDEFFGDYTLNLPNRKLYLQFFDRTLKGVKCSSGVL